MAAVPTLRRYAVSLSTTAPTQVVGAVATGRALVISKITVAATATSTITISIGGLPIVSGLVLGNGQVYTETGLVALATDVLIATAGTANALTVSIFGEEVDN